MTTDYFFKLWTSLRIFFTNNMSNKNSKQNCSTNEPSTTIQRQNGLSENATSPAKELNLIDENTDDATTGAAAASAEPADSPCRMNTGGKKGD